MDESFDNKLEHYIKVCDTYAKTKALLNYAQYKSECGKCLEIYYMMCLKDAYDESSGGVEPVNRVKKCDLLVNRYATVLNSDKNDGKL